MYPLKLSFLSSIVQKYVTICSEFIRVALVVEQRKYSTFNPRTTVQRPNNNYFCTQYLDNVGYTIILAAIKTY